MKHIRIISACDMQAAKDLLAGLARAGVDRINGISLADVQLIPASSRGHGTICAKKCRGTTAGAKFLTKMHRS